MRSLSNLFNNFKVSLASVPAPANGDPPVMPAIQSQQDFGSGRSNTPTLNHKNSRSRFDALMARSGIRNHGTSNVSNNNDNYSLSRISSGTSVGVIRQQPPMSPIPSLCSDINHSKWTKLNANLAPFATARMEKLQAQDIHFSKDVRRQQTGICYGASAVWFGLQECTPAAAATHRMNALMSGPGIRTAWTVQKFYNHVSDEFEAKPRAEIAQLQKHGAAHYDTAVMNQSSMLGLAAKTMHTQVFSGSGDFAELGRIMAKSPGKFTLPMVLSLPSGGGGRHAMNVVSNQNKTLTVFDSNIGEFNVSAKDFPRFMAGMQDFYQSTRGMNFHSIAGIQAMHRLDANSEPALLRLVAMTPAD